ncbi:basic leucine zipper transcriptional factor ATF-like 2 [Osmerus mordax]|uniref:basic leucine zipper transcriptional factor ATF-like 2 n=1 Tax=Osmerus mordax TaxID=8014 RepID=UPI003510B27C
MCFTIIQAATNRTTARQPDRDRVHPMNEMPPLFMDSRSESSVASFSGEDSRSPTDWESGGGKRQKVEHRGKRKERNRDAARKSRKKQTDKADLLHQELQGLEKAKSTLEKEILGLRRDHKLYSCALVQHQACCSLLLPMAIPASSSSSSSSPLLPMAAPPPATTPVSTFHPSSGAPAPLYAPSPRPLAPLSAPSPRPLAPLSAPSSGAPLHVLVPLSLFTATSSSLETPSYPHPALTSSQRAPSTSHDSPSPLLSLLTTPSPLILPPLAPTLSSCPLPAPSPCPLPAPALSPSPTLSSCPLPTLSTHPLPALSLFMDSEELSLSKLLESNDWLLDSATSSSWA